MFQLPPGSKTVLFYVHAIYTSLEGTLKSSACAANLSQQHGGSIFSSLQEKPSKQSVKTLRCEWPDAVRLSSACLDLAILEVDTMFLQDVAL